MTYSEASSAWTASSYSLDPLISGLAFVYKMCPQCEKELECDVNNFSGFLNYPVKPGFYPSRYLVFSLRRGWRDLGGQPSSFFRHRGTYPKSLPAPHAKK